ncbi:hypothetical protein [Gottfriedia luciferensis]|uniref:hypothetical protein n=1 Tax=Gottfriedia luciferensis TaxID=178774 RepID=UPI000B44BC17|nr:hypothetical protein [Gottfriedia luciferensis]
MSILKKIVFVLAIVSLIIFGIKPFLKRNPPSPPLESGTIGWTENKHGVVIAIGNKGSKKFNITDVLVNNNERPLNVKIQVSNPLKPLVITDSLNEDKKYVFKDINSIDIEPNTSPSYSLKKVNNGTSTEKDKIYGLSVVQNKSINKIIIKYRYMSITFEKEILVK